MVTSHSPLNIHVYELQRGLYSDIESLPYGLDALDLRVEQIVQLIFHNLPRLGLQTFASASIKLLHHVTDSSVARTLAEGEGHPFYRVVRAVTHLRSSVFPRCDSLFKDLFIHSLQRNEPTKAIVAVNHIQDLDARIDGFSPLDLAAQQESVEVWSFIRDKHIYKAIKRGDIERLRVFLAQGTLDSTTPIPESLGTFYHDALMLNNTKALQALMDFDVSLDGEDREENTAIEYAFAELKEDAAIMLLKYERDLYFRENNIPDQRGFRWERAYLNYAASIASLRVIQLLFTHKQEVNSRDYCGRTPLFYCLSESEKIDAPLDVLKYLEGKGADLYLKDEKQRSLLHLAAAYCTAETVEYLMEKKLEINAQDGKLRTPLVNALLKGNKESARVLLDQEGINVNISDSNGHTALYYALNLGDKDEEIILKILEKGASLNFLPSSICPFLEYFSLALIVDSIGVVRKMLDSISTQTVPVWGFARTLYIHILAYWRDDPEWGSLKSVFISKVIAGP